LKIKIFFLLFNTVFCFSQGNKNSISLVKSFFNKIQSLNIVHAKKEYDNIKDKKLNLQLAILFDLKSNNGYQQHNSQEYISNINLENRKVSSNYFIDLLILIEEATLYKNNRIKAFDLAHKGYQLSESIQNSFFQTLFILKLLKVYTLGIVNSDENVNFYLNKLLELNKNNTIYLFKYYLFKVYLNEMGLLKGGNKNKLNKRRTLSNKAVKKLDYLSKILNSSQENLLIEYYHLKGLNELSKKNNKTAHNYFKKELELLKNKQSIFYNKFKYENLKEISRNLGKKNKNKEAISYLKKSKLYESKLTPTRNSFVYNLYISELYYNLSLKDSAFLTMKSAFQNSLQLNFKNQNSHISSLEVKNKTAEKEKEILISEQKRKQNRNLLYGSLVLIALGGIIGLQSLKNSKKKRKLAEREKELEIQKNLTLIKEQELVTINAMVDGQEKERTRIAEDLHDNLGSVLATLKLHFENLRFNKDQKKLDQEALFNKTESLIDEAYLKVRSIAHAKNAGVIASQGLLTSIQMMAEKISSADNISIEVVHFGLNKRLENSLEIGIFRIIQELITNTIKHANASNATINLSLYDNTLTIIVEDNGKGFDTQKVDLKNGMGLNSIQTRIQHLQGTFDVDTTIDKGTSIILNIPIT
jgi:signal transduction histidine kinase